jgi:hypothetical protein
LALRPLLRHRSLTLTTNANQCDSYCVNRPHCSLLRATDDDDGTER